MSFEHPLGRFGHAPQAYDQPLFPGNEDSENMSHELHHIWQEAAHATFANGSPVYPQWFHNALGVPNEYQELSQSIRPGMNSGEVRGDSRFVYQESDPNSRGPGGWEAFDNYRKFTEGNLKTAIGGVILLGLLVVAFAPAVKT